MPHCYVTGTNGFIGKHFVRAAEAAKIPITPLTRPWPASSESKSVFTEEPAADSVIIHFAAHSTAPPYDTLENCLAANVLAPLQLFRTAIQAGIRRFIIAGTCFEYGRAADRYEFIPPDAPLEPTQTYPASKAAASIAFSQLAIENGLHLSIHRIFQPFGDGEAPTRLWPALKRAALEGKNFPMTSGEQIRDFIPVAQVVDHFLNALANPPPPPGQPIIHHVATGNPTSLRNFAETWWQHWNASGQLEFGKFPSRPGEINRIAAHPTPWPTSHSTSPIS